MRVNLNSILYLRSRGKQDALQRGITHPLIRGDVKTPLDLNINMQCATYEK